MSVLCIGKISTMTTSEFNDIPVVYCKRCHSLEIIAGSGFPDYCAVCGSTDLGDEHIEQWLKEEEERNK